MSLSAAKVRSLEMIVFGSSLRRTNFETCRLISCTQSVALYRFRLLGKPPALRFAVRYSAWPRGENRPQQSRQSSYGTASKILHEENQYTPNSSARGIIDFYFMKESQPCFFAYESSLEQSGRCYIERWIHKSQPFARRQSAVLIAADQLDRASAGSCGRSSMNR